MFIPPIALRFLTKAAIDLVDFNINSNNTEVNSIVIAIQWHLKRAQLCFIFFLRTCIFTNHYYYYTLHSCYITLLLFFLYNALKWVISSFNPVFYCFFSIHTESSTILSCRLNDIYFDSYIFVVVVSISMKQEVLEQ